MEKVKKKAKKPKFAFITPSYSGDFERCKLLVESIKNNVQGDFEHYIIVDKRDFNLFKKIENDKTKIVTVELVLSNYFFRLPYIKKWWFSWKTLPVRNWIIQQIVKLSMGDFLENEILVNIDSDIFFIRPFNPKRFVKNNKVRLLKTSYIDEKHEKWYNISCKILKIDRKSEYFNYVGNLITWRRDNLKKLCTYIKNVWKMDWRKKLSRTLTLAEHSLYGVFVDQILKKKSGHFISTKRYCYASWDYNLSNKQEFEAFFKDVQPKDVAMMVHSKSNIPVSCYRKRALEFWSNDAKS